MNLRSFFAILICFSFSAILVLSFQNCGVNKGEEDLPSSARKFSVVPGQFADYMQRHSDTCGESQIPQCRVTIRGQIYYESQIYRNAALTICHKRPTDLDYKAGGCIHVETDIEGFIVPRDPEGNPKSIEVTPCIDTTRIDIAIFMDFIPKEVSELRITKKPILANFSLPTCL